jgi:hypothetical protein
MKRELLVAAALCAAAFASLSQAATQYYIGATFISTETEDYCVLSRFRSYDGSFTLAQADGLYALISGALESNGVSDYAQVQYIYPSENEAQGITGEAVTEKFLTAGTSVCTVGGAPVDAVALTSAFNCEYQNENQMCIRLYVHTGVTDLSSLGIPYGGAGAIGGIFIKREVWNATSGLLLGGGSLPLANTTLANTLGLAPLSTRVKTVFAATHVKPKAALAP